MKKRKSVPVEKEDAFEDARRAFFSADEGKNAPVDERQTVTQVKSSDQPLVRTPAPK